MNPLGQFLVQSLKRQQFQTVVDVLIINNLRCFTSKSIEIKFTIRTNLKLEHLLIIRKESFRLSRFALLLQEESQKSLLLGKLRMLMKR